MNIDAELHFEYVLRLGDNALIIGQRLSEWCGHSPFVEEDVAMANTALDHIGRARMLLSHAADVEGLGKSEDDLAYKRTEREFKNFLITELPIGDFAFTIARQALLDAYHYFLFEALTESRDETLAAIAAKAVKECEYHLRRSSRWLCRLGDGTAESHERSQAAVNRLWRYGTEFFAADLVDEAATLSGLGPSLVDIESQWQACINELLTEATLEIPPPIGLAASGRSGQHTEHMGFLLAEMQYLQRAYPDLQW